MYEQPQITEDQRMYLLHYLDDRRSKAVIRMMCAGALALLLFIPAMMDASELFQRQILFFEPTGTSKGITGLSFVWAGSVGVLIASLASGWQRDYGSCAPINEVRRCAFSCCEIEISTKGEDRATPPYKVIDRAGFEYVCPVYLDFKHAMPGDRLIGIITESGHRYAIAEGSGQQSALPILPK